MCDSCMRNAAGSCVVANCIGDPYFCFYAVDARSSEAGVNASHLVHCSRNRFPPI